MNQAQVAHVKTDRVEFNNDALETVLLCVEEDCNRLGHNLLLGESEKFGDIAKVVVEFGF